MFQFSDKEIKRLLDAIFAGTVTEFNLPVQLYLAIGEHLKNGLYEGYGYSISSLSKEIGKGNMNLQDLELLAEMRTNIYMFSAAKTYQQVKEMTSALVDSDGTVVPFNKFREQAGQIFEQYNQTWLKTEYDTAIGQGQSAMTWRQIEKDAEVLPLLKYDAIMDKNTSDICRPLDGLIAPVNDPIWKTVMPLNHFNCRCIVRQLEEGEEPVTPTAEKEEVFNEAKNRMQDVFKMNAGMDGYVFKEDHPYFTVPKSAKEFAKDNFGLPIPKNDGKDTIVPVPKVQPAFNPAKTIKEAERWAKENGIGKTVIYSGISIENANAINKTLKQVFDDFAIEPLESLTGGSKSLGAGNGRVIKFNKAKTKPDEVKKQFENGVVKYEQRNLDRIKAAELAMEKYKDDPRALLHARKQLREAKEASNFKRWSVHVKEEDVVEDLFIHEAGHVIEDQLLGRINRSFIQGRFGKINPATRLVELNPETMEMRKQWGMIHSELTEKEVYSISRYGASNHYETFAESLVMYYREPEKMPVSIKNYFDKLKEYAKRKGDN